MPYAHRFNVGSQSTSVLRGFAVRDISKDGVRLSDSGQQVLSNVERVEVLKGPSSLLYGQLEPGGLVNIVTKRPLPNPRYNDQLTLLSYPLDWRACSAMDGKHRQTIHATLPSD